MQPRLNPLGTEIGQKFVKYLVSAHHAIANSALPAATAELVNIRVSQINGCGGCLDMHTKEAARAGESPLRLNLVAAWRETSVFTDAERAALELAEQGTRLADGGVGGAAGVSDDAWANAAKHYDDDQLMALVGQIGLINAFTRMNVMTHQGGGDYVAGRLG